MIMYKFIFSKKDYNPDFDPFIEDTSKLTCPRDSVGRPQGAQAVDQFDSEPFMMGENGFRRSDIGIMMSSESDQLKQSIAARLVEIKSQPGADGLNDHELAQLAIPRSCQSPASLTDWQASLDCGGFAKAADEIIAKYYPKQPDEAKITFNEDDSGVKTDS